MSAPIGPGDKGFDLPGSDCSTPKSANDGLRSAGRKPFWRLPLCLLKLCGHRTNSDATGCWGECETCHHRVGFVSRADLQAYIEREEAARKAALEVYQDAERRKDTRDKHATWPALFNATNQALSSQANREGRAQG